MQQFGGFQLRVPSNLTRFLLLALLAVSLMQLDARTHQMQKIRAGLTVLVSPIQLLAAVPVRIGGALVEFFRSDKALRVELERWRAEQPLLMARLQRYEALEAENTHLRALLGTSALVADKAVAAELREVASEPFRRTMVIAKGEKDGLYVGQPVIDPYGIRGQVSEVGVLQSRAILLTDPGHAIPVQINRNGLRAIAFGTGAPDTVSVRYLTASADIKEGDLLISSGIGGGFPFGYPVARVKHIVNNPDEAFLDIAARPVALIGHDKEVLLIWPSKAAAARAKPAEAPKQPAATVKPAARKPVAPVASPPRPVPAPAAVPTPPPVIAPQPAEPPAPATPPSLDSAPEGTP